MVSTTTFLKKTAIYLLFLLIALLMVVPFLYMFITSFRVSYSAFTFLITPSDLTIKNYITIFENYNFLRYTLNSFIVVIITCILNNIVSAMAGYGFAKKDFPGRNQIFFLLLITLMIPSQVTMIPLYIIMKWVGWINSFQALILPLITAFGTFLMRQFMLELPDELLDAAIIDGCSESKRFYMVVLPLVKSALIALTIFTFITAWNNFLWPLVVTTNDKMRTVILGLSVLQSNYRTNYGLVMAGSTLTFLPPFLFYVILQKKFVQGVTLSGLKG